MEIIRPSADLRNHYAEISKTCKETQEPVYVTVNGRGDTVLLSMAQYAQMKAELELLKALAEAEEDVRQGRVAPMQTSFDSLKASLLERKAQ
ncbi:MAG TPA: type II toxin-antitoxin system Phd/YefM family antitoxin [Candidatus Limiplasma sp.]|nr:type II toxin-antitoxin system Phd/YefM family antitoxin [Candidatus Limiplasma sp.]